MRRSLGWHGRGASAFSNVELLGSATSQKLKRLYGTYLLSIGAAGYGQPGCHMTLAQGSLLRNACMFCGSISLYSGADYDSGSYASSTAYITGEKAVENNMRKLRDKIREMAAVMMECPEDEVVRRSGQPCTAAEETFSDIGIRSMCVQIIRRFR